MPTTDTFQYSHSAGSLTIQYYDGTQTLYPLIWEISDIYPQGYLFAFPIDCDDSIYIDLSQVKTFSYIPFPSEEESEEPNAD